MKTLLNSTTSGQKPHRAPLMSGVKGALIAVLRAI